MIGSPELELTLVSEQCLKDMAHLGIKQRCAKIKEDYGVDVPRETLRKFYKRRRLRFAPAKPELYPHNKTEMQLYELQ